MESAQFVVGYMYGYPKERPTWLPHSLGHSVRRQQFNLRSRAAGGVATTDVAKRLTTMATTA